MKTPICDQCGIDIIVPAKFEGRGENLSGRQLADRIPGDYQTFIAELLAQHDIKPEDIPRLGSDLLAGSAGGQLLEVAVAHPIKLMANALGVPPDFMINSGQDNGIPVAALVGAKEHALKQVAHGVDLIVAQGTEASGHCGEVSTLVLVPEVIDAIDNAVPALAAGGIMTGQQMAACVALGARRGLDGFGVGHHRGSRNRPAHQAEDARGDLAGHHPLHRAHGQARAATGLGVDGRVAAQRNRPPNPAAAAAVHAVRAHASPHRHARRHRTPRGRKRCPPISWARAAA